MPVIQLDAVRQHSLTVLACRVEGGVPIADVAELVRLVLTNEHRHRQALDRRVAPPMREYPPRPVDVAPVLAVLLRAPDPQSRYLEVVVEYVGGFGSPLIEELRRSDVVF